MVWTNSFVSIKKYFQWFDFCPVGSTKLETSNFS